MEGGGQNRGRGDTMDTMDRQIQKPVCFFLFTIRMTILREAFKIMASIRRLSCIKITINIVVSSPIGRGFKLKNYK